jgi:catechol 2,3-dioxygenase-like lactoylglutathione lyase family enzyme
VAPWWDVGDAYTVRIERPEGSPRYCPSNTGSWPMVTFLNDTQTAHFWLGVADRCQAMEHALFDTNPFMGRIHWEILTPHERGMHAAMYNFPLEDGKTWGGSFFDRNWSFRADAARLETPAGPDQGFRITGQSADGDGHRIAYDYSPLLKWFTALEELDGDGQLVLRATVERYAQGVSGQYVFLRGRDFYQGPQLEGARDEAFTVNEDVGSLAFYVRARAAGTLEVQLLDPSGTIRHRALAPTGGEATTFEEVSPVPQGQWKVRYLTAGALEGTVLATGLIEISGSA